MRPPLHIPNHAGRRPIDDILQVVTLTGNWNFDSTSGANPKQARLLVVWKKYPKARDCWLQACRFGSLCAVRPTLTAHKISTAHI